MLVLSIIYQSRKAYKLLSKLFTLPSKRTLQNSLHKHKGYTRLNEAIFHALEGTLWPLGAASLRYVTLKYEGTALPCIPSSLVEMYLFPLVDLGGMLDTCTPFRVHHKNPLTNVGKPDENCSGGNCRERFWLLKR